MDISLGIDSIEFIVMLPAAVLAYYLISPKIRQYWMLVINVCIYASFGVSFLMVVIAEAIVIWFASMLMEKAGNKSRLSFLTMGFSCFLLSGVLLGFRLAIRINGLLAAPLGISFYTLQAISYLIDLYRGEVAREKRFIRLLIYLSFFPTVTSGPIYRYRDFSEEYKRNLTGLKADYSRITNGIVYMIYGYFLKLVIAERIAIM